MTESKNILRKHFLEARQNIIAEDAQLASIKAALNFLKAIDLEGIKTIAIYHPTAGEISPIKLLETLGSEEITFCLPVVKAKDTPLEFHAWKSGEALINSSFYPQLLEPTFKNAPLIPDLIVVPMVAFDENKHRIGYGAGFYDRTIHHLKKNGTIPVTVGYAFEIQKCSAPIPADAHDIKLDSIVTDKCVY